MPTHIIRRAVAVPMRDGVKLRTDVFLPGAAGPVPTLLQRTPYDRSDPFGTQHISNLPILRALDAGFAVVVQDTRGRYDSDGDFDPFVHEGADGADTVAWIRDQDFSDGRVGSFGASYVGATQMLLAAEGVEGHVAMAPTLTTGNYQQHWTYRGGALQLGFVYLWIIEALGGPDADHRRLPADHPARATLAQLAADPDKAMGQLPVLDLALIELAPYLADWLEHPTPDEWWSRVTPLADLDKIQTSALHIAGFNDIFLEGSVHAYRALREGGATPEVRDGQYLVIGPWSHGNMLDWQGDTWLGYGAAAPAIDVAGMQLEFFSAVMDGRTPDLPRVRYFTSGVNQWRTSEQWPPPATTTALHLGPKAKLDENPVQETWRESYVSNPLHPVPTVGGATFLPGILFNRNDGPKPQDEVEGRDDVLVFRTEVLHEPTEVTGPVVLELWAASTATDCDWTARLTDVDEKGRSVGVVDGILRSRYRNGPEAAALTPGKTECFRIELGHISHVFAAGHRIGLQVASSNFPRFDRNPQQMIDPVRAEASDFVAARQTLTFGDAHPSRLLLPTVDMKSS